MLKKITEPQALYQKHHDGEAVSSVPENQTPEKKKKMNIKMIGSLIAVALFIAVGIGGVAVVQRQRQLANTPVAPTAPESKPAAFQDTQAAIPGICALTYTISPAATPTPVPGSVTCVSKTASKVLTAGSLSPLTTGASVNPGDIIEYAVTLRASGGTASNVSIEDTLPGFVTFLKPITAGVTATNGTVTSPPLSVTGDTVIKYQVTVSQSTTVQDLINTVVIKNNGVGKAITNACSSSLKLQPKVQALCEDKLAYSLDGEEVSTQIADAGSVERDTTFRYRVIVKLTGPSDGAVTVVDTLPAGLNFVNGVTDAVTTSITGTKNSDGTTTVLATLAEVGTTATVEKPQMIDVYYDAVLDTAATPGTFTNSAIVKTGEKAATACTHSVKLLPAGTASCEYKGMYTDTAANNGTFITDGSDKRTGDTFWYRVGLKAVGETTAGTVKITDVVPNSLEITTLGEGVTNNNGTLTKEFAAFAPGEKPFMEFQVKVKSSASGKITNKASIATTGAGTDSCVADFNIPTFGCNESCVSDNDCKGANSNYSCVSTAEGSRCRLTENTSSTSCQPPEEVAIGCNDTCATNADCSNPSHICYNTGSGNRCRLDTNVASESCTSPVAQVTPTPQPGQPAQQPVLPQELPQTGPEDWANWLKAGLVTLGVGAVLLLLL